MELNGLGEAIAVIVLSKTDSKIQTKYDLVRVFKSPYSRLGEISFQSTNSICTYC